MCIIWISLYRVYIYVMNIPRRIYDAPGIFFVIATWCVADMGFYEKLPRLDGNRVAMRPKFSCVPYFLWHIERNLRQCHAKSLLFQAYM